MKIKQAKRNVGCESEGKALFRRSCHRGMQDASAARAELKSWQNVFIDCVFSVQAPQKQVNLSACHSRASGSGKREGEGGNLWTLSMAFSLSGFFFFPAIEWFGSALHALLG